VWEVRLAPLGGAFFLWPHPLSADGIQTPIKDTIFVAFPGTEANRLARQRRLDAIFCFRSEKRREVGRSAGRKQVSVEHFRRRADECRRLANTARNDSDKAFWLGLVERWQALESQNAQQPVRDKSRTPRRRQSVLASAD
jgi:hypothetical protein